MGASDIEFKRKFRMSRPAFEALVSDLSPYIKAGKSRNKSQNLCARMKIGVALYYFAHGGSGENFSSVSGLSKAVALKYVHQIAKLITTKLADKWMGNAIIDSLPNYMEEVRSRFHSNRAFSGRNLCFVSVSLMLIQFADIFLQQNKTSFFMANISADRLF